VPEDEPEDEAKTIGAKKPDGGELLKTTWLAGYSLSLGRPTSASCAALTRSGVRWRRVLGVRYMNLLNLSTKARAASATSRQPLSIVRA
jgi:hypothetical protein